MKTIIIISDIVSTSPISKSGNGGGGRGSGVAARAVVERGRDIESLRGRMGESERQVEGLFESLLSQSFGGGNLMLLCNALAKGESHE